MLEDDEIRRLVYMRFPKLPTERTCMTEYRFRTAARQAYEARIRREIQRPAEISRKLDEAIKSLREEVSAEGAEGP